jgi:hypothetical protein
MPTGKINPNMSSQDVLDLIILDYKTQTPFIQADFCNITTTGMEAQRNFALGGHGAPRRVAFDSQKNGTLTVTSQIGTMELFAMLSGRDMTDTFEYLKRFEVELETADTVLGLPPGTDLTPGSVYAYKRTANGADDLSAPLSITYAGGDSIALDTVGDAGQYAVYGVVRVNGVKTVNFDASHFPKNYSVYGYTTWKNEDGELAAMALAYYKVSPQSNWSLSFDNQNIISITLTFDLMEDSEKRVFSMSLIGEVEQPKPPGPSAKNTYGILGQFTNSALSNFTHRQLTKEVIYGI